MQQSQRQWFQNWYKNSSDYIFLFHETENTCVWQNRECSFFSDILAILAEPPASGTYPFQGALHTVTVQSCTLDQTAYRFVQIGAVSMEQLQYQDIDWMHQVENQVAEVREQVFGITNAVAALYEGLDDCKEEHPSMLLEAQWQHLNRIRNSCCRILQPSILLLEQCKYYQKRETQAETIFLDLQMSNFVQACRSILGVTVKVTLEAGDHLCVQVHPQRLEYALLCLMLHIFAEHPEITNMQWEVIGKGEQVLLRCSATAMGDDDTQSLYHRTRETLYSTRLSAPTKQILRLFCETYQVMMLYADTDQGHIFTLQFQRHHPGKSFSLKSPARRIQNEMFSPFQIFLSNIADYRFY